MEQVIGIDLAKRVFQVHIASPLGKLIKNTGVSRDKLTAFIAQQPPSKIVMESCGSRQSSGDALCPGKNTGTAGYSVFASGSPAANEKQNGAD